MNEQDYNQLRESAWRRKLTPAEEAELQKHLAAHPDSGADWQTETALTQLLGQLPAAPSVSSNFSARVLQAVALEAATQKRARTRGWSFFHGRWSWLPKTAAVGLMIAFAAVGYQQHQVHARVALAKNVAELSAAVPASDVELIRDFEPISRMSDAEPKADTELLALLKLMK